MRLWSLLALAAAGFAQIPSGQPQWTEFTARMAGYNLGLHLLPGHRLPTPFYLTGERVNAVRSDGTIATRESNWQTIWLPTKSQLVTIDLDSKKSEVHFASRFHGPVNLRARTGDPVCAAAAEELPGRARFEGWDNILGVRVARYRSEVGDARYFKYYAPQLNCYALKSVAEDMIWHGLPLHMTIYEAVDLRIGRPNPEMFQIPKAR